MTRAADLGIDLDVLAAKVARLVARLAPGGWVSLVRAAEHLDEPHESLRKKIKRSARGASATTIDGIEFRRLGRLWKCRLPEGWR